MTGLVLVVIGNISSAETYRRGRGDVAVSIAWAQCSRRDRSHPESTGSSAFLFLAEHAATDPMGCSGSLFVTLALSPCLHWAAPPPLRTIRRPRCTPRQRENRAIALHPRAKLVQEIGTAGSGAKQVFNVNDESYRLVRTTVCSVLGFFPYRKRLQPSTDQHDPINHPTGSIPFIARDKIRQQ